MEKTIAIIKGDGIGPEIVTEAMGVLDAVAAKFGHTFTYVDAPMGGCAIDAFGVPLPDSSLETCLNADSVLLGAVGGPKWDSQPSANRPERGLLKLRGAMKLCSNVRPARMFSDLSAACPLRPDIAAKGIDDGDEVAPDLDTGATTNVTKNETYQAEPFPPFIKDMIAKGGLMASLKAKEG